MEAKKIETQLGVQVIRHDQKKPLGFPYLLDHFKLMPKPVQPIAIVGDRLLTDILYGTTNHCYTILVTRILDASRDNPNARRVSLLVRLT